MLLTLLFWLFMTAYAQEPDYSMEVTSPKGIVIYIDKEQDNKIELTKLIAAEARVHKNVINDSYAMKEGINYKKRKVRIYDQTNIKFYSKCDYDKDAIGCAVKNDHWIISSSIVREEMEASFIINLYDETATIIGTASVPIYGRIEFEPRWKKTIIISDGMMGQSKQEIFEQWPDKKIKHPPYVRSKDISQALISLFLSFDK